MQSATHHSLRRRRRRHQSPLVPVWSLLRGWFAPLALKFRQSRANPTLAGSSLEDPVALEGAVALKNSSVVPTVGEPPVGERSSSDQRRFHQSRANQTRPRQWLEGLVAFAGAAALRSSPVVPAVGELVVGERSSSDRRRCHQSRASQTHPRELLEDLVAFVGAAALWRSPVVSMSGELMFEERSAAGQVGAGTAAWNGSPVMFLGRGLLPKHSSLHGVSLSPELLVRCKEVLSERDVRRGCPMEYILSLYAATCR